MLNLYSHVVKKTSYNGHKILLNSSHKFITKCFAIIEQSYPCYPMWIYSILNALGFFLLCLVHTIKKDIPFFKNIYIALELLILSRINMYVYNSFYKKVQTTLCRRNILNCILHKNNVYIITWILNQIFMISNKVKLTAG